MILLVEDDDALGAQIKQSLEEAGHDVRWIQDGDEAKGVALEPTTLIVLDLMLPGTYGLDLLKIYRTRSDVPVLILSARDQTTDKVRALELGADDYLTKPFWPEELLARVAARLRRPEVVKDVDQRTVGDLRIDFSARQLARKADGEWTAITTTAAEFDVMAMLARRPGQPISRQALVDGALDPEQGTPRALDVHISRLRKKLGPAAPQLATVWGIGYRLDAEAT
ncbi:MAG: response regulator transcription factor [Myxococcota bacterium]